MRRIWYAYSYYTYPSISIHECPDVHIGTAIPAWIWMSTNYCMTVLCQIRKRMNIWKKPNFKYNYMHIRVHIWNFQYIRATLVFTWFSLIVFFFRFCLLVFSFALYFCRMGFHPWFLSTRFFFVKTDIWIWAGHMCCIISLSLSHWNCAWDLNWVRTSVRRFSLFCLGWEPLRVLLLVEAV